MEGVAVENVIKDSRTLASAPEVARKDLVIGTLANLVIGTVAGLAAVFLPRMMLLLSVDTELAPDRYITMFQPDFITLGVAFAVTVGVVCAIVEFGPLQEPKAIFMTALGIPALLSGVLNTASATNNLQKAEQQKVAVLRGVSEESGIAHEQVRTWEVVGTPPAGPAPGKPSSALDSRFALVTPAFAESFGVAQSARFDPGIQIQRPSYVLALGRANSEAEAERLARALQKDVPTAQVVRTDQGFFVVDSVTPRSEADALLRAIQLKSKKNLNPSLLQVPK